MKVRPGMRATVPVDPHSPVSPAVRYALAALGRSSVVELVAASTDDGSDELARSALASLQADLADDRLCTRALRGRTVVEALLRHLAITRPDLVVLDSHSRSAVAEALLGSVSADLVRSSPSPTLVLGPHFSDSTGPGIQEFVVAVDGSEDSYAGLAVASHLAIRMDVGIRLVEVATGPFPEGSDVLESGELARLVDRLDPAPEVWDVLHGDDVAQALLADVQVRPGAVLVLGMHGRSRVRAGVVGGVAAKTVRLAEVPVLLVSPEAAARLDDIEHITRAMPAAP